MRFIVYILIGFMVTGVYAAEKFVFANQQQAQQFENLLKEFRCMTCPNQNIADSHAPIAVAMQEEIYRRFQAGESAEQIRAYLLSHYGDYVLYKPLVKKQTWFLWGGPFLFLGLAIWGWTRWA